MHPERHRWLQLLPEYPGAREPGPSQRKGSHLALLVFISSSKTTQLLNSVLALPSALSLLVLLLLGAYLPCHTVVRAQLLESFGLELPGHNYIHCLPAV